MSTSETHLPNGQQAQTAQTSDLVSTGSETSTVSPDHDQAAPPAPLSPSEQIAAVADLLGGGSAEGAGGTELEAGEAQGDDGSSGAPEGTQEGDDEGGSGTEARETPPATLTDVAEALGIEPGDVYAMEVTTGDGETVKIGDLKDFYQNRDVAMRETVERSAALDERESVISQDQRLWGQIGNDLVRILPPETVGQLKAQMVERDQHERQLLVDAIPEMADAAKFDQFRMDAVEFMGKRYGMQPHELAVTDHRHILIMRDLMRAEKRLDDLRKWKPKRDPPRAHKARGRDGKVVSQTDALVAKAKTSRHDADKIRGIAALLKGSKK